MSISDDKISMLFKPETFHIYSLFSHVHSSFVIPPFQRHFSWGEDNIQRLFEDLISCISSNIHNPNNEPTLNFLGTIISVKINKSESSFLNSKQNDQFSLTYNSIIDGQQRLTTFTLFLICFYNRLTYLYNYFESFASNATEETNKNIYNSFLQSVNTLLGYLDDMLAVTQNVVKDGQRISFKFPRLFRVPDDFFGAYGECEFTSALGLYIYEFLKHLHEEKKDPDSKKTSKKSIFYNYKPFQLTKEQLTLDTYSQYVAIERAVLFIENSINFICNSACDNASISEERRIRNRYEDTCVTGFNTKTIITAIKNGFLYFNFIQNNSGDKEYYTNLENALNKNNQELLCAFNILLLTSSFIFNNVVTFITSTKEDYAFSMFDSLNTTGEPLTAYETFKAKIINNKNTPNYDQIKKYFKEIDNYLNSLKGERDEQKVKATNNILISYAREMIGNQLGKTINSQRAFLNSILENDVSIYDLVKELYIASSFWSQLWDFPKETVLLSYQFNNSCRQIISFEPTISLCLHFLTKLKHTIIASVISRFLSICYNNCNNLEQYKADEANLKKAIKMITAFAVIYRTSFSSTKGIDTVYKDLFKYNNNMFCTLYNKKISTITSEELLTELKEYLNSILEKINVNELPKWQNKIQDIPHYSANKDLASFVLFLYYFSKQNNLCNTQSYLSFTEEHVKEYLNPDLQTVEHIAPQNKGSNNSFSTWDNALYDNKDILDNLGNLLLLDRKINSLVNNSSPIMKEKYYNYFSKRPEQRTTDLVSQINTTLNALKENSFNEEEYKTIKQQFSLTTFNIGKVNRWLAEDIKGRCTEIASSIWPILREWLPK